MFVAPPGYQPIYSPRLPYLGPIYGGLREGVSIYLQGSIPENITRFFVNLLCGESESSDIALHFNPRFDGRDKIKVNGNEFHHFKHRIPFERVHSMNIAGDVSIQTINVIGGGTGGGMGGGMGQGGYPGGGMGGGYPGGMGGGMGGGYPGSNLPGMGGQPIYNPPVPYSNMIPGGMFPKRTIIIRGMVPYGGDRLCINFVVSRSRDIAFHLNPRVREGVVVRNSMIGGCWGQEEREISMNPFVEGQYFDMSIRCGNGRFKVFVNGQNLFDFVHRFQSCNEIDMLEISGDVQISYIHF